MSRVNSGLKRVFTVFNVLFAIVGGVITVLTLLSHIFTGVNGGEDLEGQYAALVAFYIMGILTTTIATLGAYGAHKESKGALITFLVCMAIGGVLMLRVGVPTAAARPQLGGQLEESFQALLPLDRASGNVKSLAESIQSQLHCCGLFSYQDWGDNVPDSCLCIPEDDWTEDCQTVSYRILFQKAIYSQTCFPIILHYVLLIADIMIGIVFTLAVLALLGFILSAVMIHQMHRPKGSAVLLEVPTTLASVSSKYKKFQNPPSY